MLKTRLLTVAVLVPLVLAALFLLPSLGWALAMLAVAAVAAGEWARLARCMDTQRHAFIVLFIGSGLVLLFLPATAFASGWPAPIVFGFCGAASLFWLLIAPPWVISRWPVPSATVMLPLGWLLLLALWMALVELQARSPWMVLAAMAMVWIADTAAYFAGRAFGRHKLAPLVSPGKSWEGVYGALLAVAAYALVLVPYAAAAGWHGATDFLPIVVWVALALLLTGVSVVGDLFESWLKRSAGVKDSGSLLPGHGGVLDRTDALVSAMPVVALAVQLLLVKH